MISISGLWFLFAGYLVMIVFLIVQRLLRPTASTKSFRRGAFDRHSTLLIGLTLGTGLNLPLILDILGIGLFIIDLFMGIAALATMVFGLGLRIWAAVTLGRYYTTTLMITENHKVVTSGPYAWVRHPAYLGVVLLWLGFGVLSGNLIVVLLFPVMFIAVYLYRISVEEKMLVKEFGDEYIQYQKRTRKLIPFIY